MKKFLLSLAVLAGFAPAYAGTGTEADPYTVAEVLSMTQDIDAAWVKGYIVGYANNGTVNQAKFEVGTVPSNIIIADAANCTDNKKVAAIQLPAGDTRKALNIVDNPTNLGKELAISGKITKYCGAMGIKEPTAYKLNGEGGGTTTPDEPVTPPASGALYEQAFKAGIGDFTLDNVALDGISNVWSHATYKESAYMKASAFVGGACKTTDSYLVSPMLDATKATKLAANFDHAINKFGSLDLAKTQATFAVRVEGGQWQTVAIPTYGTNSDWNFVNSGDIDLSAFSGKKFQVAFHYTSSTESAGTWEVMNLKINGEGTITTAAPVVENTKVANIAAFKAGKDVNATYEFTSPVTAIYQNGNYLYTQDATGYLLIFGNTGQTYAKGDVIPAGFTGKYAVYHEGVQMATPANFAASTAKAEVTPVEITLEEIGTDMVNDYVKIEGVTIAGGKVSQDGTELAIYDSFKINPADGENLTIIGFVSWYNALQIVPIEVTDAAGVVIEKIATPVFTPAAGAVYADTKVTIACATEGAAIHYTTDGTEPTAASALYTEPIVITEAVTIKAIAVKEGLENSAVATAEYTIKEFVSSGYLGEFDTFNDGKANNKYDTYTNATGWTAANCCIVSGSDTPDKNENPTFAFIGGAKTLAAVMNGKTSAVGKITSPVLENGIKDLSFNYGLPYSDTKIDFTVTVYAADGTTVLKSETVTSDSPEKLTTYSFKLEGIDHKDSFKV